MSDNLPISPREDSDSRSTIVSSVSDTNSFIQMTDIKNETNSRISEEQISTLESEKCDVLICGLCLKYMQNPKWLPCLHSYCCSCLEIYQDQRSKTLDDKAEKPSDEIDPKHKPLKTLSEDEITFACSPIKKEGNPPAFTNESKKIPISEEGNSEDVAGFDKFEKVTKDNTSSQTEEASSNVFTSDSDLGQYKSSDHADSGVSNKINVVKEYEEFSKKNSGLEKPKSIECPVCKEICNIPPEGIDGLMSNSIFSNLIQMKEKLSEAKYCDICKLRDTSEVAVALCRDCSDFLCKSCWKGHAFTRYTLSHKVLPLEEMDNIALDDTLRSRPETKCPIHFDEILKYFCSDCTCLVCRECVLLSHQGHSCVLSSAAAECRKKDFQILLYGYNEKLHCLRKDEYDEYKLQNERISNAERAEIKKVDSFFQELMEAIEKARNDVIEITEERFRQSKKQCSNRFDSSKTIEKNMTSIESVLKVVLKQASDEEFLEIEPFLHKRLVHILNKPNFKPFPVSWYEMPIALLQNPVKITYELGKINVSCFKIKGPSQKSDAAEAIPCQNSLEELLDMGQFKRIIQTKTNLQENEDKNTKESKPMPHKGPDFIDATIWPNENATDVPSVQQSSNDIHVEILASCSDSSASTSNNELPVDEKETSPEKKRKRGKRKNKRKGKLAQLQNMFQGMSLHNKGMIGQPQTGLYGNSYSTAVNAFGTFQGQLPTQDLPSYMYPQSVPENVQKVLSVNPRTEFQDNMKMIGQNVSVSQSQTSIPVVKSLQQTLRNNGPSLVKQPSPNVTKGSKRESDSFDNTSVTPTVCTATSSLTQNKVISLKPKFRLDVKLSSDLYEPLIKGVYCLHKTSIIVSDTKNGKVKTFSVQGQFIRCVDVLGVERAIFTANILIYCSKNEVHGRKEDGGELNALRYEGKANNCLLTWFPKNHILVASGKQVRQYSFDLEKGHFLKKQSVAGGRFEQIQDIRCDQHGQKLVVIEAKSVVICNLDGNIIGNYKEDTPIWNPTSACFDKKGYVFVTDGGGNRLLFLSPTGEFLQQWDTCPTINRPTFVATNSIQPLYITGHDRYVHVYDYSY